MMLHLSNGGDAWVVGARFTLELGEDSIRVSYPITSGMAARCRASGNAGNANRDHGDS